MSVMRNTPTPPRHSDFILMASLLHVCIFDRSAAYEYASLIVLCSKKGFVLWEMSFLSERLRTGKLTPTRFLRDLTAAISTIVHLPPLAHPIFYTFDYILAKL